MKYSHEHWCLRVFISIAMFPAICRYEDEAFNMSEESGKIFFEHFIIKKPLQPVPSHDIVEQAEQCRELRPQQADSGMTRG